MKNLLLNGVIFLSLITIVGGCRSKCEQTLYYTANVPVYDSKTAIRASIDIGSSVAIDSVAEMLDYKQSVFFRNGIDGIHVIDNSDLSVPDNHTYIKVTPCYAMEVDNDQLYVIQGTDLVVFDISNPRSPAFLHRVNDLYNADFAKQDSFVVGYRKEEVVKVINDVSCSDQFIFPEDEVVIGSISAPHGQLLAFRNNLYSCDNQNIISYSLNGTSAPTFTSRLNSFNNIPEIQLTLLLDSILLAGSGNGFRAFDITTSPDIPRASGGFFASGNCNHVALWDSFSFAPMFNDFVDERFCFSSPNIGIVDLITRRVVLNIPNFIQPYYIHFHNERLLLCNGNGGFRIFEASDRLSMNEYTDINGESRNINARLGLLHGDKYAIVYGDDGVFQYDIVDRTVVIKLGEFK